jgi:hypothetical protein
MQLWYQDLDNRRIGCIVAMRWLLWGSVPGSISGIQGQDDA